MGGHITLHGRSYDLPCEAIKYYRKKRETYRLACTNVQTKKRKLRGEQTLSWATVQQTSDHTAHTTRVDFRRASSPIKGQKTARCCLCKQHLAGIKTKETGIASKTAMLLSISYLMFGFSLFHSAIGGRTPMAMTSSRNAHKCS